MFERAPRCDQDNSVSVIVAQTASTRAERDATTPSSSAIPASMSANNEEASGDRESAGFDCIPWYNADKRNQNSVIHSGNVTPPKAINVSTSLDLSSSTKFRLIRGEIFVRSACAHRFSYDCFNTGEMNFLRDTNGWLIERERGRERIN